MIEWLSIALACLALGISLYTAWQTFLRNGTIKATHPTQIFFGPDGPGFEGNAKVYIRFFLYSTAPKGRVLESMYLRVRSPEATQVFPIWVTGDKILSRGAGIFVGPDGVASNHHFLLPTPSHSYSFMSGKHNLEIVGRLVGDKEDIVLGDCSVLVTDEQAKALKTNGTGVYFDWGGENKNFVGTIHQKPKDVQLPSPDAFLDLLKGSVAQSEKDSGS